MIDRTELFAETVNPLNTYPGRKGGSGTWQKIISEIPKCSLFIDAMCGSGIVGSLVHSTGCQVVMNDLDRSVIDTISSPAANIEFRNEHYKKIIQRFDNGNPGRVFYFDPPYLMNTRSYQKSIYKHDWVETDHLDFIVAVQGIKSSVMISHYPCKLYDVAFKNWRKITYNSMTRAGVREECLYMNFQQPVLLQCYEHVGENFTDRQRIKRKVARLAARLKKEPGKERAAILSSIIEQFSYAISAK